MLFAEWCSRPNRRAGVMLPEDKLEQMTHSQDAGFRSVYLFDEPSAKEIQASGNSKGLSKYEAHSKCLFIDLDDGDKSLGRMKEWVRDHHARADVFSSGGKGYHFHIQIEPIMGMNVPYSQHAFARTIGIPVDDSLYRPASLIALPGRVHPKTRCKKVLVDKIDGGTLTIPLVEKPVTVDFSQFRDETDQFLLALFRMQDLILTPPDLGRRYQSLWSLAKNCADSKLHPDTTYNILSMINSKWSEQKSQAEIERAVKDAYRIFG